MTNESTPADVSKLLEEGLELLRSPLDEQTIMGKAGLAQALQSLHSAVETHFRIWMSDNPYLPETHRAALIDRNGITWHHILESLRACARLPPSLSNLPETLRHYNRLRNQTAHGETAPPPRAEVERYARLVQKVIKTNIPFTPNRGAALQAGQRARGMRRPRRRSKGLEGLIAIVIAILWGVFWMSSGGHSKHVRGTSLMSVPAPRPLRAEEIPGPPALSQQSVRRKQRKRTVSRAAVTSAPQPSASASDSLQQPRPEVRVNPADLDALDGRPVAPATKRTPSKTPKAQDVVSTERGVENEQSNVNQRLKVRASDLDAL